MKVLRIQAHNVMGIDQIDVDLSGHNLYLIGGKNGAGKSSVQRALVMALCGKSGADWPDEPVRTGSAEAWVTVWTDGDPALFQEGGLRIERKWERRPDDTYREIFRIIGDDEFEAPSPTTLLKDLYKHRGFDPLSFLRMTAKKQVEELQRIVGLDFSEVNDARKTAYDQRTVVNRQAKDIEAKFNALPHYPDAPEEPVSVTDLLAEASRRDLHNQDNDAVRDELRTAQMAVGQSEKDVETAENAVREIEELLKKKKAAVSVAKAAARKATSEANKLLKLAEELEDEDTAEIEAQIEQAEITNKQVAANAARDELKSQWKERKDQSEELTANIEEIDAYKAKQLDEAPWPVDGLRYSEDGTLRMNGIPFSQASTAEKIAASVQMGMSANPRLKLLIIEHGEAMDNETLQVVADVAAEHDYQILCEFMTRDSDDEERCQVIIEEGRVKGSTTLPEIAGVVG